MDMDMGHDMGSCKVSMLWNWNVIDACFLSSTWHITTRGAFAASCIGVALLAVALEAFRRLGREYDQLLTRQYQVASRSRIRWVQQQSRVRPGLKRNKSSMDAKVPSLSASSSNGRDDDHEAIKTLAGRDACCAVPVCSSNDAVLQEAAESQPTKSSSSSGALIARYRVSPLQQLIRAAIHAVTFGLAYIIMLLAMYFNGYIIISIILGTGIGKFLLDWMTVTVALSSEEGEEPRVVAAAAAATNQPKRVIDDPTFCCG